MTTKQASPLDEVTEREETQTLDKVLRSAPSDIREEDLDGMIATLRRQRAQFISQDARKQAKKEGVEEPAPALVEDVPGE